MNQKEIGELRRRLKPEKNNITYIYGCFVNTAGEIVAYIDEAVSMIKQEEAEVYLERLKKCLSGIQERNLIDIAFTTGQVAGSEEHGLLMAVYRSQCRDEEARNALFRKIIILDKNEEYCIVESGTRFGISQYDFIVLNSGEVREQEIMVG